MSIRKSKTNGAKDKRSKAPQGTEQESLNENMERDSGQRRTRRAIARIKSLAKTRITRKAIAPANTRVSAWTRTARINKQRSYKIDARIISIKCGQNHCHGEKGLWLASQPKEVLYFVLGTASENGGSNSKLSLGQFINISLRREC